MSKRSVWKKVAVAALVVGGLVGTMGSSCSDAEVVNDNISTDADNFKILRKVVFYNAILGEYVLVMEGFCSVDPGDGRRMTVTCKVGNEYKRNALGASDNVLWWYEQLEAAKVSPDHYKIVLKPQTVIPNVVLG